MLCKTPHLGNKQRKKRQRKKEREIRKKLPRAEDGDWHIKYPFLEVFKKKVTKYNLVYRCCNQISHTFQILSLYSCTSKGWHSVCNLLFTLQFIFGNIK